jgi:hypothetical protein
MELPCDSYAELVHCVDGVLPGEHNHDIVLPKNYTDIGHDSGRMWYMITNLDSNGCVAAEGGLFCTTSLDSAAVWIWMQAENHLGGTTSYGPVRVVFRQGPAGFHTVLNANPHERGILLRWEAIASIRIAGFRLCRAVSVPDTFEAVRASWTPYVGEITIPLQFSYLDTEVLPGETYWYRLEVLGDDARWYRTEDVVSATWAPGAAVEGILLRVAPNPVRTFADIYIGGSAALRNEPGIWILDSLGRTVWSSCVNGGGSAVLRWNLSAANGREITPGIYFCHVRCGPERKTAKIIHLR